MPRCSDATERLLSAVLQRNAIDPEDLVSIMFTATQDLRSAFPAEAARRMGLGRVPLMCAQEIPVEGSMPSVIRLLDALPLRSHARRGRRTSTSTVRSRSEMTPLRASPRDGRSLDGPIERVAVLGTGLMGTSVAMAAARAGCRRDGLGRGCRDAGPRRRARGFQAGCRRSRMRSRSRPRGRLHADPHHRARSSRPRWPRRRNAIVTEVGSIMESVVGEVALRGRAEAPADSSRATRWVERAVRPRPCLPGGPRRDRVGAVHDGGRPIRGRGGPGVAGSRAWARAGPHARRPP